ncbi:hypothetical protein NDU88_011221 [Pleurodeles waltl]|uniref:Endonuclease/exonuclease/phosphatase domain-containing protein n=1 Tax=Pleurodeles waltl TaxID=8319 RepID=A0AAV7S5H8_PLEWA|nr:hypothetical protein NDU88_011221 [Pleurodeles waltl]
MAPAGAPKASPSAPVRAWTAPSARTPGPHRTQNTHLRYDAASLNALNPGRTASCYQASPKRTHGPFACQACKYTFHRACIPSTGPRSNNHLKCILLNTRSVHKHAIELWDLLDTTAPDVAFITETWMNVSSAPDIALAIPDGYKIARKDRANQIWGGIAIIYKSSINVTTSTEDTLLAAEHMHFQIHTNPRTTLSGTLVYRPPGPRAPFSESITDFITQHTLALPDYILLGDLNFHLEKNNDTNTATLLDNLANLGLKQLVNTPTHTAGHTLDPIFFTSNHVSFSHASEIHWTDHRCVHFTFKRGTHHLRTQPITLRPWNKISAEQLPSTLNHNQPAITTDANNAALSLTQWITNCADNLAPLRSHPRETNIRKPPRFTDALKESKKTCRSLEKTCRKEHTAENMSALKTATREHHQLIRSTKRTSYKERLDNNTHNSKELFNIVKELSNPNVSSNTIMPSQELCNSLATFFHQKITDLHDSFGPQIPPTTTEPTAPAITLNAWTPISSEETRITMNTIHSGSPSDPCPHHIFNKADAINAPYLQSIINSSFASATFPRAGNMRKSTPS